MNCVLRQGLTCRTKKESQEATSARKQRNRGAILFGWGDSLIRDMLDAGVFDCLNSEFDDIQVSVLSCVPSMWLTFVTNSADESLRWRIGGANLEEIGERKGRASAQASRREGCRSQGGGLLLGPPELPAARHLYIQAVVGICYVLRG